MTGVDLTNPDIITGLDVADQNESAYLRGPPGTGKTTQALARFVQSDYEMSDLIWVTYRTSLARDILDRMEDTGEFGLTNFKRPLKGKTRTVGTIHAVCRRTIVDQMSRQVVLDEMGVDPGDEIGTVQYHHKRDFCEKKNIRYTSRTPWTDSPGQLLFRAFNWLPNSGYDPSDPDSYNRCSSIQELKDEHNFNREISSIYDEWSEYKHAQGIMDYPDMLTYVYEHGLVPEGDYLVVDEFHDATPLIAAIVSMWADEMDVVLIAGDQDQIVNAYSGPSRELFHRTKEKLNLPEIQLEKSYRVPRTHWMAATRLLRQAHDVPGITPSETGGSIKEYRSPSFEPSRQSEEWGKVPYPETPGSPPHLVAHNDGDMLFLARMRIQVAGISRSLDTAGIIHRTQNDFDGWEDSDRLHIHNALQKLTQVDTEDSSLGVETTLGDYGGGKPLEAVELLPDEIDVLLHHTPSKHLAPSRSNVEDFRLTVDEDMTARELDEQVLKPSFWREIVRSPVQSVNELNKRNMSDMDRQSLKKALRRYHGPVEADEVNITVLTIHAAKGTEAAHVVVYDGISRRIAKEMRSSKKTRENEYRTWYVGLTRASDTLHIMRDGFDAMNCQSIIPENLLSTVQETTTSSPISNEQQTLSD